MSLLYAANREGDRQLMAFAQYRQQDQATSHYEQQHNQTLSDFLEAVATVQKDRCHGEDVAPHQKTTGELCGSVTGKSVLGSVVDQYWEQHPPQSNKKKKKKKKKTSAPDAPPSEGSCAHITGEDEVTVVQQEFDENKSHVIITVPIKLVPDLLVPEEVASLEKIDTKSSPSVSSQSGNIADISILANERENNVTVPHEPNSPLPGSSSSSSSGTVISQAFTPMPTQTHLYALSSAVSHPHTTHAGFVCTCPSCSSHLEAASSCGMAFLQPLPPALLAEPMTFDLRGNNMTVHLTYLGEKIVNDDELLAMQTFHRSILCWETDGSLDPTAMNKEGGDASSVLFEHPLSATDWVRSSHGAWYIFFPLKHTTLTHPVAGVSHVFGSDSITAQRLERERQLILCSPSPEGWLQHLQACAKEAKMLVDNLYQHQYRADKVVDDIGTTSTATTTRPDADAAATTLAPSTVTPVSDALSSATDGALKYPLLYSHRQEDLVGQLFSRDKDYIFLGVPEDMNPAGEQGRVTFDDVMLEGKQSSVVMKKRNGCGVPEGEMRPAVTYLEYFLSKGRITMEEAEALRDGEGELHWTRALFVATRLLLSFVPCCCQHHRHYC